MRNCRYLVYLLCLLVLVTPLRMASQSDVGGITGTVTDKSGAVVPNAKVEIRDLATNLTQSTKTSASGQYTFTRVAPSTYKLSIAAPNFATAVIGNLVVSVGKTATANLTLQVGTFSETIEVQAGTATELQTVDASVGNVLNERALSNMPNMNRDSTSLVLLQPGAQPAPGSNTDENAGGQIMGARSDQNTFMLDGGDATSNTDGNGAYFNSFGAVPRAAIPTPVESLEEFRVVTNNNTAGYGRSAGAEVQMVTRRGSNAFHGALYDYYFSSQTNANTWERNNAGQKNPELHDSRFGARLGGPIFKDKTFFFVHFEGRRRAVADTVTRWAPAQSIRDGLLGWQDADGVNHYINPKTQTCDGVAAAPPNTCDPLGIGLSPATLAIWNQMPKPNTTTGGDGVNFFNFTSSVPRTINENFGVARLDHQISTNWHATASYRYGTTEKNVSSSGGQVAVTTSGVKSLSTSPVQPRYLVFGLAGQVTPNFSNDVHVDYLRHYWAWKTQGAQPQLTGLPAAVQLVNESVSSGVVPINIDTQQARQRSWNGKDWNLIDNASWLKGKHLLQFGGHFGWQRLNHTRDDKVTYAMTNPIYYSLYSTSYPYVDLASQVPATVGDETAFSTAYLAMMGIVDMATQVRVRDGSLSLLSAGTPIHQFTSENNWELHFADSWRLTPSLTVTYGLGWGVQMPPFEASGSQTVMVDTTNNNKILTMADYLGTKKAFALQGKSWNPTLGFMPVRDLKRKYPYDPDYGNLSPRLAMAWNPAVDSGPLGWLFGQHKAVIRAGWSRFFDRVTGVDIVMTPALGVGFSDVANCAAPLAAGGCGGTSTPGTAYRIGTSVPAITLPALPATLGAPVIPGNALVPTANTPYVTRDYRIDPGKKTGSTDTFDLSIQRELPSKTLIEVGFVGRLSHNLYQKVDINQIPYMYTMGGETFADAFDKLQIAYASGGAAAASALTQPFFEAALGGPTGAYCVGYATCTAAVVAKRGSYLNYRNVFSMFRRLDPFWVTGTMLPYTTQSTGADTTVSWGRSTYAGGFFSLRKDMTHGVNISANYTLSKTLDNFGWNQDIIDAMMDAYYPDRSYGPANFDRRHVFNAFATWELPFGHGKRWASSGILDKIAGGWSTSYIFTLSSGIAYQVYNGNSCLEYGDGTNYNDCSGMIPTNSNSVAMARHDSGVTVTNGWGSQSDGGMAAGAYPNAFSNPAAVATSYRLPLFSDQRSGNSPVLFGQKDWGLDFTVKKTTKITERLNTTFSADFFNLFNHPRLSNPNTDISSRSDFGVLNSQYNAPRTIQWGLRFDF